MESAKLPASACRMSPSWPIRRGTCRGPPSPALRRALYSSANRVRVLTVHGWSLGGWGGCAQ
eukprot:9740876-Alexandrium_andersonii.AAC.1